MGTVEDIRGGSRTHLLGQGRVRLAVVLVLCLALSGCVTDVPYVSDSEEIVTQESVDDVEDYVVSSEECKRIAEYGDEDQASIQYTGELPGPSEEDALVVSAMVHRDRTVDLNIPFYYIERDEIASEDLDVDASSDARTVLELRGYDFDGDPVLSKEFQLVFQVLVSGVGSEGEQAESPQNTNVSAFVEEIRYTGNLAELRVVEDGETLASFDPNVRLMHSALEGVPEDGFVDSHPRCRAELDEILDEVERLVEAGERDRASQKIERELLPGLHHWLREGYETRYAQQFSNAEVMEAVEKARQRIDEDSKKPEPHIEQSPNEEETIKRSNEPVEIADIDELAEISDALDADYLLVDDIDASGLEGFEPIGDEDTSFSGTFDGNGYVITGLEISRSDENHVGLFGKLGEEAQVQNVDVMNASVTGGAAVGVIAGANGGGSVREVSVSGEVRAKEEFVSSVGGVVGLNEDGTVYRASSSTRVRGEGRGVGGVAGQNFAGGEIKRSNASGDVIGGDAAGGLVGFNRESRVSESYATGDVSLLNDLRRAGGLVGLNSKSNVVDAYASGDVSGSGELGALVGSSIYTSDIRRTYAVGEITGDGDTGGLVGKLGAGEFHGPVHETVLGSSYWDAESTNHTAAVGVREPGDGKVTVRTVTGLSTDKMQEESSKNSMEKLDFDETWTVTKEYPEMEW